MVTPGDATSGLVRPSRVGPRLEKYARYTPSEWFGAPVGADHSATAPTVMARVAAPGEPTVL